MTKKNNLFKNISIFLCLVPMLVLSLFCLVPNKKYKVSAANDVVSNFSFIGTNFTTFTTLTNNGTSFNHSSFMDVYCSFSVNNASYSASVTGVFMRSTLQGTYNFNGSLSNLVNSSSTSDYTLLRCTVSSTYVVDIHVTRVGNITNDINRVVFTSSEDGGFYYNHVYYYDVLDNFIRFTFPCWNNYSCYKNFMFEDRTYFINLNLSNNTYYEAGYTDGYNQGVTDGSSGGYNDGYIAGETIGYQNGYNAGVEHGGNYSFMGLIGAVIDAPVSAFTSLLNFELLGVNILGFISGLLTLALIIFIIKLCMGGK